MCWCWCWCLKVDLFSSDQNILMNCVLKPTTLCKCPMIPDANAAATLSLLLFYLMKFQINMKNIQIKSIVVMVLAWWWRWWCVAGDEHSIIAEMWNVLTLLIRATIRKCVLLFTWISLTHNQIHMHELMRVWAMGKEREREEEVQQISIQINRICIIVMHFIDHVVRAQWNDSGGAI